MPSTVDPTHSPPSSSPSTVGNRTTLHLRLSLSGSNTAVTSSAPASSSSSSFKRSLEELFGGTENEEDRERSEAVVVGGSRIQEAGRGGFVQAQASSGGPGRNSNKRQRSESSASNEVTSSSSGSGSTSSSVFASPAGSSSGSSSSGSTTLSSSRSRTHIVYPSNSTASAGAVQATPELPPRLPTPRLDDVQMSDIPLLNNSNSVSSTMQPTGQGVARSLLMVNSDARDAGLAAAGSSARPLLTSSPSPPPPQFTHRSGVTTASLSSYHHPHHYHHTRRVSGRHSSSRSISPLSSMSLSNEQPPSFASALAAPMPISPPPPIVPSSSSLSSPSFGLVNSAVSISNVHSNRNHHHHYHHQQQQHTTTSGVTATAVTNAGTTRSSFDFQHRSTPSSPHPGPLSLNLTSRTIPSGSSGSGLEIALGLEPEERYRATMERYTAFESAIAALRRSVSPPSPHASAVAAAGTTRNGGSTNVAVSSGSGSGSASLGFGGLARPASPPRLPPLELSSLQDEDDEESRNASEGTMNPRGMGRPAGLGNNGDSTNLDNAIGLSMNQNQYPYHHQHHYHRVLSHRHLEQQTQNQHARTNSSVRHAAIAPSNPSNSAPITTATTNFSLPLSLISSNSSRTHIHTHTLTHTHMRNRALGNIDGVRDVDDDDVAEDDVNIVRGETAPDDDDDEEEEGEEFDQLDNDDDNEDEENGSGRRRHLHHRDIIEQSQYSSNIHLSRAGGGAVPQSTQSQPRAPVPVPVGRDVPPRVELSWSTTLGGSDDDSLDPSSSSSAPLDQVGGERGRSTLTPGLAVPMIEESLQGVINQEQGEEAEAEEDEGDDEDEEEYLDAEEELIPTTAMTTSSETNLLLHQPPPPPPAPPLFRDRLDSALEALRSPSSPLVPGLVPVPAAESTGSSIGAILNSNDSDYTAGEGGPTATTFIVPPLDYNSVTASQGSINHPQTSPSAATTFSNPNSNAATNMLAVAASTTPASSHFGLRFGLPPTLPPILTERDGDDVDNAAEDRLWRRRRVAQLLSSSSNSSSSLRGPVSQNRSQILDQNNNQPHDHMPRSSSSAQAGRLNQVQGLGEVPLPSPSLSGFYDWLEAASANAGVATNAGASIGAPSNTERTESMDQGSRPRASWEEDILSGLMRPNPDLGLNLRSGLQQQQQHQNVRDATPSTFATPRRNSDMNMESDTERERELERLPWTLGVPQASSSSSQVPPRLNLPGQNRESRRRVRLQHIRQALSELEDGWDPMHVPRPWYGEAGPFPLRSASAATSSSAPLQPSGLSPNLLSPSSPPPPVLPSTQINSSPTVPPILPLPLLSYQDLRTILDTEESDPIDQRRVESTREGHRPLNRSSSGSVGGNGVGVTTTTRVVGSDNSLMAENAVEVRRRMARLEALRSLRTTPASVEVRSSEEPRDAGSDMDFSMFSMPSRNFRNPNETGNVERENGGPGSVLGPNVPGSSTGVSMYSGVMTPPIRPILHSVRHAHPSFQFTPVLESPEDDRRTSPWSQEALSTMNRDNGNSAENMPPPSMAHQESLASMLRLQLPSDENNTTPILHPWAEPGVTQSGSQERNLRAFTNSSSSDSSMSVESFIDTSSGESNASVYGGGDRSSEVAAPLNRAMFLDTQLPSPGLGGLFDSLGSQSVISTRTPAEPQNIASSAASSTTLNSSGSSSILGRFTPSPARTSSDDDADERRLTRGSGRLRVLSERLADMRNESLSEMIQWWDRDNESVLENLSDDMDVDVVQEPHNSSITNSSRSVARERSTRDPRRPDLLSSPSIPRPIAVTDNPNPPSATSSSSSERHSGIIDPTLFAPGPFRNTMETLAMRAREYAAQASSSSSTAVGIPRSAVVTSMSSPTMSLNSPSSTSSLSPPVTYTSFAGVSRPRQQHATMTTTHHPPVIPPLSFEDDVVEENNNSNAVGEGAVAAEPRSEVQEPLSASSTRQWISPDSDDMLRRQQLIRDRMRNYQGTTGGQHHMSSGGGGSLSSASISSLSSDGGRSGISLSHLERSPDSGSEDPSTSTLPAPVSTSVTATAQRRHGVIADTQSLLNSLQALRESRSSNPDAEQRRQHLYRLREQAENLMNRARAFRAEDDGDDSGMNEDTSTDLGPNSSTRALRERDEARTMATMNMLGQRERELGNSQTGTVLRFGDLQSPPSSVPSSSGLPRNLTTTASANQAENRHVQQPTWHDIVLNRDAAGSSSSSSSATSSSSLLRPRESNANNVAPMLLYTGNIGSDSESSEDDDDGVLEQQQRSQTQIPEPTRLPQLPLSSSSSSSSSLPPRSGGVPYNHQPFAPHVREQLQRLHQLQPEQLARFAASNSGHGGGGSSSTSLASTTSSAGTTTSTTATVGGRRFNSNPIANAADRWRDERTRWLREHARAALRLELPSLGSESSGSTINESGMRGRNAGVGTTNSGTSTSRESVAVRLARERIMHRLRANMTGNSSTNGAGASTGGTSGGIGMRGGGGRLFGGFRRRFGDMGDYMNDDEFDASYESLLSLQDALGEVKPKSTPEAVLKKLQRGKYREWRRYGGEEIRCPICLEDYGLEDDVLKSGNCAHWMHKMCLETWFKNANTCPVCRMDVEPRAQSQNPAAGSSASASSSSAATATASTSSDTGGWRPQRQWRREWPRREWGSTPSSSQQQQSGSGGEGPSGSGSANGSTPRSWYRMFRTEVEEEEEDDYGGSGAGTGTGGGSFF